MSTMNLQINPESSTLSLQPLLIPANTDGHDGSPGCHGVWFDVVLVVVSVVFIGYLSIHAKKNLKKLYNRGSYILISYYGSLAYSTSLGPLFRSPLYFLSKFFIILFWFFIFLVIVNILSLGWNLYDSY